MLYSCKNDIEEINTLTSVSNLPTQSIRDFESIYSDSAKIQILVKAPEVNRYGNAAEPYVEFPNGIEVYFYDEFEQVNSMLTAKSALYHESEELWEARDSVVAINVDGEILNTDLLFWDEKRQLIYSNKFVKITTVNEVILGEGFEANQDFTDWVIKKPKGTIYLEEEY
ncbi:MAG: LPS export ABC transporter periplasmic protein LptC [Bacteroidales bacterium]|nr:MAG: LPS export ABC transporter periplasmic protein LptC [Bacteroidales bacterium]